MVVDILLFSEPRLDELEIELPVDAPLALLVDFPLEADLCHISKGINTDHVLV